eukprot:XP_011421901.1 PREDICTED: uncharacterized protein LOC105324506 [Crassostrea gigas]
MFHLLVEVGFKEIEVGFPAASDIEYHFTRKLIEEDMIPKDVTIQVLTQARDPLIKKTMDSIKGARRAIVHLYNSTSIAQRKIVFQKDKNEIIEIALQGVRSIQKYLSKEHKEVVFQYSPESFTATEKEFSLEICQRVYEEWMKNPSPGSKEVIINLPATVELFGPHHYADLIQWFSDHFKPRENIILSVHTHNDRGTGVAASELALLAGATRVEGTLFGNGERTGNVDIVTMALNLFTHGIDPKLDLSDLPRLVEVSNLCTNLPVPLRHPYAGELVFTAFSGSHQDAIKKGFAYMDKTKQDFWEIPYLAVDPKDIGRTYEAIIRINSQSGKGGLAYVLEKEFGYRLPRGMQIEFSKLVQRYCDQSAKEMDSATVFDFFQEVYLKQKNPALKLIDILPKYITSSKVEVDLSLSCRQKDGSYLEKSFVGCGNGPIDAAKNAIEKVVGNFSLVDYQEHTLSKKSSAKAISFIGIVRGGITQYGAGIDSNITLASVKSLVSALNVSLKKEEDQPKVKQLKKS